MRNHGGLPGRLALAAVLISGVACVGAAQSPASESGSAPVVARIGERKITLAELDVKAQAASFQAFQDLYDARRTALLGMIDEMLIADEAKSRGITTDALLQQEVQSKVVNPTDEEIAAFYEQNKARMGGQTLEQIKPRIEQFLSAGRQNDARQKFLEQLRTKAGVVIDLEPPRIQVEVAQNDPVQGPASAKVTIIEFSDYQCPYCKSAAPTLSQVKQAYGDKVRIVFRDYPLSFHRHRSARGRGRECANAQGKFWEYHDKLFANQAGLNADN